MYNRQQLWRIDTQRDIRKKLHLTVGTHVTIKSRRKGKKT